MADFLNDIGASIPLFRIIPNWGESIQSEFQVNQKIDSFPGTIEKLITYYSERQFSVDLPFLFFTKQEEFDFIEFFHNQRGRWKKFWMPAPVNYFTPVEDVSISDTIFIIKDNRFRDSHRGYERLWLELKNGDWIVMKIISVLNGPFNGQETLTLSTPFDRNILVSDIVFASLFFLGRFELDIIEIEHITDTACRTTQKFIELIQEYP